LAQVRVKSIKVQQAKRAEISGNKIIPKDHLLVFDLLLTTLMHGLQPTTGASLESSSRAA